VTESSITIEEGEKYQIEASVEPEDATEDKTLNYKSSDEEIAIVDEEGLVTAKAAGKTQIEISSAARPNVKATVAVEVTEKTQTDEKPITKINVTEEEANVLVGRTYDIKASVEPEDTTDEKTLSYTSSNEEAATVDQTTGRVTAVAVGEAQIEISSKARPDVKAFVKINVTDQEVPIKDIEVEESAEVEEGATYQIEAVVVPKDTTDEKTLNYTSSDEETATVDENGLVTAKKEGEAQIEISSKARPDVKKTVTVKVTKKSEDEKPIIKINVKEPAATLAAGATYQIEASVEPEDTTDDKVLKYTSGNEAVATVNETGLVTAVAEGTAKIEITCVREEARAEVEITVTGQGQPVNPDIASPEKRMELTNQISGLKAKYADLSKYTAASAEALRQALIAAEGVLGNPNATTAEVQQAMANLAAAELGLTLNPPTQTPNPEPNPPKKGYKFKVGALQYQVTKSSAKNGTVSVVKLMKKTSKKITIPATVKVKVNGKSFTFKVTQINGKVFQKNKKLKEVVIGANISKIGSRSFYGCKNLGKITFKGTKAPKAASKAFTGIKKNAKVYVPKKVSKSNLKKFKTTMKTAGKKITIKKK
ncbi:hypothetical protein D3Z36_16870, partial [Lachnospiraceae bacterium]|nr:hypothetical protein [Lachnospiraceae bacterium]